MNGLAREALDTAVARGAGYADVRLLETVAVLVRAAVPAPVHSAVHRIAAVEKRFSHPD